METKDYTLSRFVAAYESGEIPQLVLPDGLGKFPVKRLPAYSTRTTFIEHMLALYRSQVLDWELDRLSERLGRDQAHTLSLATLEKLHAYLYAAQGWPTMAGLGTHKDQAVREPVKRIIEHTANYAVHAGIGLTHGHLFLGYMRWFREYWLRARSRYRPGRVFVGGVPLWVEGPDMEWETRDPPPHWTRYGCDDAVSPQHVTLETRFPCIVGTSANVCSLFAAGGHGMREEHRRDLLFVQHALKSTTPYSHRPKGCYPLHVLLDNRMETTGLWYWDSLVIESLHDREINSITEDDCQNMLVVRVGEQEAPAWNGAYPVNVRYFETPLLAGKFIVERALEKYVQLVEGIRAELGASLS